MRLTELTRPQNIYTAEQLLKEKGWLAIGRGSYATIFENSKYPYVLKLFRNQDQGYLRYLSLIQKISNVHFPKLIGKPIRINKLYWGIRMEKLIPILKFDNTIQEMGEYIGYLENFKPKNYMGRITYKPEKENKIKQFPINFPSLAQAMDLIAKYVLTGNITADVYRENVMKRNDGTLVITDPAA